LKTFYYFAYGILTSPNIINAKFAVGAAVLNNYTLEYCKFTNVIEKSGSKVNGVLWELPKRLQKMLDEIEGYPELYIRKNVPITCNGKTYDAEVYVMTEEYREEFKDIKPSSSYLKKMNGGYSHFNVPKNILTEAPMNPSVFNKNLSNADGILVGFEFEFCVHQTALAKMYKRLINDYGISSSFKPYNARRLVSGYLSRYFGDIIVFDEYHGGHPAVKKKPNFWYIEPDPTVTVKDDNNDDESMEFVGPPLPVNLATAALDKFYKAAKNNFYTGQDENTGVHINISSQNPIDMVKLAVFLGDEYLLDLFNKKSDFASSVVNELKMKLAKNKNKKIEMLHHIVEYLIKDHNASISLSEDGKYISFRHVGGDYLNDYENIKNAFGRLITVVNIASNPELYKKEYYKKLYKIMNTAQFQKPQDKIAYMLQRKPIMVYMVDVFIQDRNIGKRKLKNVTVDSIKATTKINDNEIFEVGKTNVQQEMLSKSIVSYDYYDKNQKDALFGAMEKGNGTFERYLVVPEIFSETKTITMNTKYFYSDQLEKFITTVVLKTITPNMPEYLDLYNFIKSHHSEE
jgi:gamma-glutamylcyclotransferase (GGCT)/AIG2-like uncharacterized protein YtfP